MEQRTQIQYQWPPVTKSVIGLSVFFFLFWLATVLFEPLASFANLHMRVSLASLTEGRVWSLLLYGLFHRGFTEILFVALAVWMFGGELQKMFGLKRWWLIQILALLAGGLVAVGWDALLGLHAPVQGYHAAVMGLVSAYCWNRWNQSVHIFTWSLTGKSMLAIFTAFSVVMALVSGAYVRIGLDVAGIACGILIAGNFLSPRDLRTRFRLWNARRRLKIVRGPEKKDYGPN